MSSLLLVGRLIFAFALGTSVAASAATSVSDTLVYVGTYTGANRGQGIYAFRLQVAAAHATLTPLGLAATAESPAFLDVDPKRRLLFAIHETNTFNGQAGGGVSSYAIDTDSGKLRLISQRSTVGTGPCHVLLDREGRHLIISNYSGGSVTVVPVAADGQLGEPTSYVQHHGKSVHPQRQTVPHAHCATLDPANRFAYICDLGLDQVLAYRFDARTGKIAAANPAYSISKPGAGPRHLAFRPDGRFAYVVNELDSTVTAYRADASTGRLTALQTLSSLPPAFDGKNSGAEITVHPSGKWLYSSNRGHDSIAVFRIDPAHGTLTFVEAAASGGRTPRQFAVHPDGHYVVTGNQASGMLQVSRVDPASGRLTPTASAEVPAPACIVFVASGAR